MHDYKMDDGTELYDHVWQAGTVLLSTIRSVGVMGDERTYEHPVALRAVTSMDAMTADWAHLPYDFLADVSNEIIRKVKASTAYAMMSAQNRQQLSSGSNPALRFL